jgi:hypothetical protein
MKKLTLQEKKRRARNAQLRAERNSPSGRLIRLDELEKRWHTKMRRAVTALKKIQRQRKRLQLVAVETAVAQAALNVKRSRKFEFTS